MWGALMNSGSFLLEKTKKELRSFVQLKSNIFSCYTEGKFGPSLQCSFNWLFPYGLTFCAQVMLMQLKPKQVLIPVLTTAENAPLCMYISYILLQNVFWGGGGYCFNCLRASYWNHYWDVGGSGPSTKQEHFHHPRRNSLHIVDCLKFPFFLYLGY